MQRRRRNDHRAKQSSIRRCSAIAATQGCCGRRGALKTRGYELDVDRFNALEAERKAVQTKTEELQARRNALSKQVGVLKAKGQDASSVLAEAGSIPDQVKTLEVQLASIQQKLAAWMLEIPNLTHESVPIGTSAEENVEVRRWGTPRTFDFPVKRSRRHRHAVGPRLRNRSEVIGSRFMLRGPLARLQAHSRSSCSMPCKPRALHQCYTPYIVNADCLVGTTQLPKLRRHVLGYQGGGEKEDVSDLDFRNIADEHSARRNSA